MRKLLTYAVAAVALFAVVAVATWVYIMSNVEQQPYTVMRIDGAIEIRQYPAASVAEISTQGSRQDAVRAGFGPLAAYIFAKERSGEKIAMTAPVTQQRKQIAMTAPVTQTPSVADDGSWVVRFVMPTGRTVADLPTPTNAKIRIVEQPAVSKLAIRFSGVANDTLIATNERTLRDWAKAQSLNLKEPPTYAYYNDPFTPGPLRRNEVLFELAP